uniref:Chemosensory protein 29 n=1 Tax=Heliconius charithonia TaxID=33434 RepID=A0AA49FRN5_HELCH|nr:chemosensory protein 29 [Heliconius charithonia]
MKTIVLFAFVAMAAATEFYTTGNDHLDMDALVSSKENLQFYMDCFLDRKPCTELTASYKKILPESVKQACEKCNPNQRYQYWRFLQGLKAQIPEEYMNFRHHFDPENKYFDALEDVISKYIKPDMDMLD